MAELVQISHDPFGRYCIMREVVDTRKSCDWCGSKPGKFIYYHENDSFGARPNQIGGQYCSIGCMRADN